MSTLKCCSDGKLKPQFPRPYRTEYGFGPINLVERILLMRLHTVLANCYLLYE